MSGVLSDLRVIEGSAFVAAPSAGMTLAQLGADVIRFDPVGGGLDYRRWPLGESGTSLYWAGLNKGKRSIAIDLRRPAGRELAAALITAPGAGAGLFLTNFPASGWLDYETLRAGRPDLIMVNIQGNPDGSSEVDYTVNPATGLPALTGPAADPTPVNHVLPAWDLLTGQAAVVALLAAERQRRQTGEGQLVQIALSDIALGAMGALGFLAEHEGSAEMRPRYGNDLYGAFGRDFATKDGRRVMIVAITPRQWDALVRVTGIEEGAAAIERDRGLDLGDAGDRFRATDAIAVLLAPWCAARTLPEVRRAFKEGGVAWGPYQTIPQLLADDPRCSTENPLFELVDQPGIGPTLTPGSPLAWSGIPRAAPAPAPRLGADTDAILRGVLQLSDSAVRRLHDDGVVAGSDPVTAHG